MSRSEVILLIKTGLELTMGHSRRIVLIFFLRTRDRQNKTNPETCYHLLFTMHVSSGIPQEQSGIKQFADEMFCRPSTPF